MLAITNEQDVCTSCEAFVAPAPGEPVVQNAVQNAGFQPEMNPFEHASQGAPPTAYPATPMSTQYAAQETNYQTTPPPNFHERRGFPNSEPTATPLDSNCVKCRTPIPRGQRICFDCQNKKSSPWKYLVALLLIGVIGFFTFDYAYEQISPYGTFRKYAKMTGADDSLVYENFVLTGDTTVSVDDMPRIKMGGTSISQREMESFSFRMIYKKPNVSGVELLRGNETVFKQVFDGTSGWKYTNMPPQPAAYQDTEDGFGSKKMGLEMDEYDSLEFLNPATTQEFGELNITDLREIKEVEASSIKHPSAEKTFIVGKQKRNGKTESSLLAFDQKTGLLIGMIKKQTMGNLVLTTVITFNTYVKYPVKRKGLLGVSTVGVLMPTEMTLVTRASNSSQPGGMPEVTLDMTVQKVEIDAEIEPNYFTK